MSRRKDTPTVNPSSASEPFADVSPPAAGVSRIVVLRKAPAEKLLAQLDCDRHTGAARSVEDRWNAALGCKTSEVALGILASVAELGQNVSTRPRTRSMRRSCGAPPS